MAFLFMKSSPSRTPARFALRHACFASKAAGAVEIVADGLLFICMQAGQLLDVKVGESVTETGYKDADALCPKVDGGVTFGVGVCDVVGGVEVENGRLEDAVEVFTPSGAGGCGARSGGGIGGAGSVGLCRGLLVGSPADAVIEDASVHLGHVARPRRSGIGLGCIRCLGAFDGRMLVIGLNAAGVGLWSTSLAGMVAGSARGRVGGSIVLVRLECGADDEPTGQVGLGSSGGIRWTGTDALCGGRSGSIALGMVLALGFLNLCVDGCILSGEIERCELLLMGEIDVGVDGQRRSRRMEGAFQ